ncbi:MAG: hypothetical protein QM802_05240 [Agriterribacter sp.]
MATFIELTDGKHSQKILVNLEEVTFIEVSDNKKSKMTIIHFTSSVYATDRIIEVIEDYETVKGFIINARLAVEEKN